MEKKENYSADRPISEKKQDRFQRYPFAKRIADTILNRKDNDCIVFGINGRWGEGKSSVLNLIELELKGKEGIKAIHFNPWRYQEEDELLKNLFYLIGDTIEKRLGRRLKNAANNIAKYGSSVEVPFFSIANFATLFSKVDLERLKVKVGGYLKSENIKIVIFIDDIDRLDKEEIFTLFRLLKLTADFANTCYVLSFDKTMVAAAIGSQFGEGNFESGSSFLEKIIQIPLSVPLAQHEDLRQYCIELLNNSLDSNGIELSKEEVDRFVYQFNSNIVPMLTTPRMAVRYANTISFSLPILKGEVNLPDLMLLEAINIFFPKHYQFVKHNPDYFIGSYRKDDIFNVINPEDKKKIFLEEFNAISSDLNEKQRQGLVELLIVLFPSIDAVFENKYYSSDHYTTWDNQKRICSPDYFNRYFSYSVIKGDISDIEFESLINGLESDEQSKITGNILAIITKSTDKRFLQKVLNIERQLTWEAGKKLLSGIVKNSDLITKSASFMSLGMDSGHEQLAIIVHRFIARQPEDTPLFEFVKSLLSDTGDYSLAAEIKYWLNHARLDKTKIFSDEEYQKLNVLLLEKAMEAINNGENLFAKYPTDIASILAFWSSYDNKAMRKYVLDFLDQDKNKIIELIAFYPPIVSSSAYPSPYRGDLRQEDYKFLTSALSKELIRDRIYELYNEKVIKKEEPVWAERNYGENTPLNLARQFIHWYNKGENERLLLLHKLQS